MHGLGLGLTQYKVFLEDLMSMVHDRPILIPLHPHVSQEIFHPQYLRPMGRQQSAETLASLLRELGWVKAEEVKEPSGDVTSGASVRPHGVTMVSHSK